MAELKTNCNTIYMDLVGMIDAINTKYQKLLEQDPTDYRAFVQRKKRIIATVETVLSQLSSKDAKTQRAGHTFIQTTYELHQFLVQLVIDHHVPSQEKLHTMHDSLTSVHMAAKELMRTMMNSS